MRDADQDAEAKHYYEEKEIDSAESFREAHQHLLK